MRLLVTAAFALLCASAGCTAASEDAVPAAREWFADRAAAAGLDFVHVNGMSGKLYLAEIMAPGVALFDYDNDGDLDVYLVQGEELQPHFRSSGPQGEAAPGPESSRFADRLYRNDLSVGPDGTRTLRFTDVTRESGIVAPGYGMGVAAGDFDNDGWIDLYLTKYDAPNQLLHNNRNGTFTDVSKASGTDHRSWSTSAAFADVNRDGWLDLYVANYVRYPLGDAAPCSSASGARDYCTPEAYQPLSDRLFLNQRNGRFADVSVKSGIARQSAPGLGVATADFNGDGWIDIYVGNDGKENQLWLNRRDGTFEDGALLSGVALPVTGKAEASMGIDAADVDDDGDEDLFVTELMGEGSNFYVNDGSGVFEDRSAPSMLGPRSFPYTGFGTAWLDFDSDGRLDVLSVNGAIQTIEKLRQAGDAFPLHQRKLLLRNSGGGLFEDVTAKAGAAFALSEVGRGAAFGDIDNDGDTDVLVGNNNGPTRLLVNEMPRRHWIGLRLTGEGGRDMPGARVELVRNASASMWRRARADGSYLSANDPRVLMGLGDTTVPADVRVTWPDGKTETWKALPIDRYTTLEEGKRK